MISRLVKNVPARLNKIQSTAPSSPATIPGIQSTGVCPTTRTASCNSLRTMVI